MFNTTTCRGETDLRLFLVVWMWIAILGGIVVHRSMAAIEVALPNVSEETQCSRAD